MSDRRVVIGLRNNGDYGVFVGSAGQDAFTASDASLMLSLTTKVSMLVQMGQIATAITVPLGLSHNPYLFITSKWNFSGVIGHTGGDGPVRPSPPVGSSRTTATINSSGSTISFSPSLVCMYTVYSQAF